MSGAFDGGECRLAVYAFSIAFFLFVKRPVALMKSDTNKILDVQVLLRISPYCFHMCCGR